MNTSTETTKNEELLQESTTDAGTIFSPEVVEFLEKAANAYRATRPSVRPIPQQQLR